MRRALAVALGTTLTLAAAPAHALGLCDPDGHFCLQIDATSAIVCDLMRLGGLDRTTCDAHDVAQRNELRAGERPPFGAWMLRFDGTHVLISASRHPALPELTDAEVAAHAKVMRASIERHTALESFEPPMLSRVHGVQVVRFDSQWSADGHAFEELDFEVRASDATYAVSFAGPAGAPLSTFAEQSVATLDALPASAATGPGEAMKWSLRGLFAAVAVAGGMIWLGRRKTHAMAPRDLWPR